MCKYIVTSCLCEKTDMIVLSLESLLFWKTFWRLKYSTYTEYIVKENLEVTGRPDVPGKIRYLFNYLNKYPKITYFQWMVADIYFLKTLKNSLFFRQTVQWGYFDSQSITWNGHRGTSATWRSPFDSRRGKSFSGPAQAWRQERRHWDSQYRNISRWPTVQAPQSWLERCKVQIDRQAPYNCAENFANSCSALPVIFLAHAARARCPLLSRCS